MVCRIDLSRSPAQTTRPNGILPVSAPSFELQASSSARIDTREKPYTEEEALQPFYGPISAKHVLPRWANLEADNGIIFDVVENSSGERTREIYEG